MTANIESKKAASIALKKAQTSIKNILGMIEDDEYCIDIMEQLLAVNGLIKSTTEKILQNHLKSCFIDGVGTSNRNAKEKLVQEVLDVIKLSNKC